MPHKPVAVVVAMQREVAPLLRGRASAMVGGVGVFELESAVVAFGGIGRAAARRAAEAVVKQYAPCVVVSAGIAGALTAKLKVGDVVCAREVIDANSGERFPSGGAAGTIATVAFISGAAEKRLLAVRWNADVVDMEASSVAAVAREVGVEFAAVKSVSDELDFEMPPVGDFVDHAGRFETIRFAAWLAFHPRWWVPVRQLNANSRKATVKLSEALGHLIDQRSRAAEGRRTSVV